MIKVFKEKTKKLSYSEKEHEIIILHSCRDVKTCCKENTSKHWSKYSMFVVEIISLGLPVTD